MKRIHIFLVSILFLLTQTVLSQNAPLTTVGKVLDASAGAIDVPVTVSDFVNIGGIALKLDYNPAVMTYVGATANPAFSGMLINGATAGQIIITWTAASGTVTMPDGSQLAEIEFSYISGATSLSWDNSSSGGSACEYKDGAMVILNDMPTVDYYADGFVTNQAAPITYAPTITDAVAGAIDVPITVENFSDIGGVALTLEYNPQILSFTGSTPHADFGGAMVVSASPSTGGMYKVIISWFAADYIPKTLLDGSTIVDLHFDYTPAAFVGNHSVLNWLTDGTACEYGDALFNPMYDIPYGDYYIDGLVAGQLTPGTYLPELTNALPGSISVPVTVVDFNDIGGIALTFEYDATVISYLGYTANAAFTGLVLGNQVNGNDGKITISYYGPAVSLIDLDYLVDIEFTYISGTSTLTWKTDGTACEYGDALYNILYDEPYEDYYFNGLVAGQVSPRIKADSMGAVPGTQISVPLTVWGFTDISSLSLAIDYDPGVLTYLGASPHPDITVNFSEGSTPGRITIGWFYLDPGGSPVSLADETVLIYLNFDYVNGTSPLIWFDNGGSCEFTTGVSLEVLYDEPTEDYYIDGLVEAAEFIWIGPTSTDWYTASNWSANLVPNSLSQVFIPSLPTPNFWPVYIGDFTLGVQCNRIAFADGSVMTVTGDMIIDPGHAFVNEGDGLLKVGGDWLNSGVFELGTGEVEFLGAVDGFVPPGVLPGQEVQNYSLTTTPALLTPIAGGLSGPTGDDAHSDVAIGFTFKYAGVDYTQLRISTNGWISLNLSGTDLESNDNNRLFFGSDPATAMAPWWDNLMADGTSSIGYLISGTAPNRVFTVEWDDLLTYNAGAMSRIDFQVKLYETTNEVEFCYGMVTAGMHSAAEGAAIGIKGLTGGAGDFIEATTGTTNTMVNNLKSATAWPTVNYQFTPPPDTVSFYRMTVSGSGKNLYIQTDVNVVGIAP